MEALAKQQRMAEGSAAQAGKADSAQPTVDAAQLQAMVDDASMVVYLLGADGAFLYVSASVRDIFGHDPQALVGKGSLEFVHPEERDKIAQRLEARITESGSSGTSRFRLLDASGDYRLVEATATNRLSEPGVRAVVCSLRELGDERGQIDTSDAAQDRWSVLVSSIAEGIITARADGTVEGVNEGALQIFGRLRDDIVGSSIKQLIPDLWDDISRNYAEAFKADENEIGKRELHEVAGVDSEGNDVALELSASWLHDQDEQVLVAVIRDVSDRKRSDDAVRISEERLSYAAEAAKDGLWDWNVIDNSVYFGPRWDSLLRLDPGVLEGRIESWFNRLHESDFAGFTTAFDMVLAGEVPTLEVEHRMLCGDEQYRWYLTRGMGVKGKNGRVQRIVGVVSDIHRRKQAEERAAHNALHDVLTELPNRQLMLDRIGQLYQRRDDDNKGQSGLILIDLDRFRVINESQGHRVGDQLLGAVARRLEGSVRRGDTVARLGSDQFAVLITEARSEADIRARAEDFLEVIRATLSIGSDSVNLTASIGLRVLDNDTTAPEDIVRDAALASQEAKRLGGDQIVTFFIELRTSMLQTYRYENDLRTAIREGHVEPYYQPLMDIDTGKPIGFEALARLHHPSRGLIPPSEFIPIAEETGLITEIADQVLDQSTQQLADWKVEFQELEPLVVTINLSPVQFDRQDVVGQLRRAIARTGLSGRDIKVEVTESLLMQNPEKSNQILRNIQALGVQICIDDFGTGYSSLSYLRQFSFDTLKIDRSFVSHIVNDRRDAELVRTMIQLGQNVGMTVVAEGVEEEAQLEVLSQFGCHYGQGYFFAKPLPGDEATKWLRTHKKGGDKND